MMPDEPREPIFKGDDGQHYARLIGANGEIVMLGEGHPDRQGAERNLDAAIRAALLLARTRPAGPG